jgi:hypothetical protein
VSGGIGLALWLNSFVLAGAPAAVRTYVVIVGVNDSLDEGVAPLHFADDDAAKYHRFFEGVADRSFLLTTFDAESRAAYPDLVDRAKAPTRAELDRTLDELGLLTAEDSAKSRRTVVYFIYVGHGGRQRDGQGYVTLADGRLFRSDLTRLLLDRPTSPTWSKPDLLHVIIDACAAYYMVKTGSGELVAMPEGYEAFLNALFAPLAPERYPFAGFLLATFGGEKTHEWAKVHGGVFSQLLLEGLSGAADADDDHVVTYAEIGAYLSSHSETLGDSRARLHVTVMPPPALTHAPLFTLDHGQPRQ